MPIQPGCALPQPPAGLLPDVNPWDVFSHPTLISMENSEGIPDDFDQLPVEEQERIKARLRFLGIRLRSDVKGKTVPLARRTIDIP